MHCVSLSKSGNPTFSPKHSWRCYNIVEQWRLTDVLLSRSSSKYIAVYATGGVCAERTQVLQEKKTKTKKPQENTCFVSISIIHRCTIPLKHQHWLNTAFSVCTLLKSLKKKQQGRIKVHMFKCDACLEFNVCMAGISERIICFFLLFV